VDETTLTVAVAAFHDRATAARAAADLERHGFNQKQIGIISQAPQGKVKRNADVIGRDHVRGALLGVISGAIIGAVAGFGFAYVQPASLLSYSVAGAVFGAVIGLLLGALTGMGVAKRDRTWYSKQFEKGQSVVTVMADGRHEEAWDILRRNGGFEVADRILPEASPAEGDLGARETDLTGRPTPREVPAPAAAPMAVPVADAAYRPSTVPAGRGSAPEETPPPTAPPSSM
jgi:hypothetical protein